MNATNTGGFCVNCSEPMVPAASNSATAKGRFAALWNGIAGQYRLSILNADWR